VSPRLPANEPRRYPANLTWWFGWLSLVPIVAPATSVLACLNAILSLFLCTRYPEKFTGKARIWMGLGVCALGMALFFAEAGLFFQWKVDQVYEQKMSISRFRLTAISGALERYRQENGGYPDVSGIMRLKALLEPDYIPECPVVDGFDGAISVISSRNGFTLTCSPPAPPGSKERPSPILMGGHFQSGPLPPPPAPPPEAGAGKAPEGTGAAGETNPPAPSPGEAPSGGKSAPINPHPDGTPSPGPG